MCSNVFQGLGPAPVLYVSSVYLINHTLPGLIMPILTPDEV